jgi:hypothetical protein
MSTYEVNLAVGFAFVCWYAISSVVGASQQARQLDGEQNESAAVQYGTNGRRCPGCRKPVASFGGSKDVRGILCTNQGIVQR